MEDYDVRSAASILASVKEQEARFERLTRALEEERRNVSLQLERGNLPGDCMGGCTGAASQPLAWQQVVMQVKKVPLVPEQGACILRLRARLPVRLLLSSLLVTHADIHPRVCWSCPELQVSSDWRHHSAACLEPFITQQMAVICFPPPSVVIGWARCVYGCLVMCWLMWCHVRMRFLISSLFLLPNQSSQLCGPLLVPFPLSAF